MKVRKKTERTNVFKNILGEENAKPLFLAEKKEIQFFYTTWWRYCQIRVFSILSLMPRKRVLKMEALREKIVFL